MTGKNIMKLFWGGFVIGALTLVGMYMYDLTRSPCNSPLPEYRRFRLHSIFDPGYYSSAGTLYKIVRPKDHPITKTTYYKYQWYIGENDSLQVTTAEERLREKDGLDDHHGVYAIHSGVVERIDLSGYRYRITIASDLEDGGRLQYPELTKMSTLKVGDRVEGGYYLGQVDMSIAELEMGLKKLNEQYDDDPFDYREVHHVR